MVQPRHQHREVRLHQPSQWTDGISGTEGPKKARAFSGVTRTSTLLVNPNEDGVDITVVRHRPNELTIARGFALAPILLTGPAPEPGTSSLKGANQGVSVHVGEHQYVPGAVFLHNCGNQPVRIETYAVELILKKRVRAEFHRPSIPRTI